jgi:transposase InsO family protein
MTTKTTRKTHTAEFKAEALKQTVCEYMEVDYNKTRKHSSLGYLSPENLELKHSA